MTACRLAGIEFGDVGQVRSLDNGDAIVLQAGAELLAARGIGFNQQNSRHEMRNGPNRNAVLAADVSKGASDTHEVSKVRRGRYQIELPVRASPGKQNGWRGM